MGDSGEGRGPTVVVIVRRWFVDNLPPDGPGLVVPLLEGFGGGGGLGPILMLVVGGRFGTDY